MICGMFVIGIKLLVLKLNKYMCVWLGWWCFVILKIMLCKNVVLLYFGFLINVMWLVFFNCNIIGFWYCFFGMFLSFNVNFIFFVLFDYNFLKFVFIKFFWYIFFGNGGNYGCLIFLIFNCVVIDFIWLIIVFNLVWFFFVFLFLSLFKFLLIVWSWL